jgi:hypothetical protein
LHFDFPGAIIRPASLSPILQVPRKSEKTIKLPIMFTAISRCSLSVRFHGFLTALSIFSGFARGSLRIRAVFRQNKKLTAYEITELIIEAVVAAAALITAIRWW